MKTCFRCGKHDNRKSWEYHSQMGSITLARSSQIFNPLSGRTQLNEFCATDKSFALWREMEDMPFIKSNGAQDIHFEFGDKPETFLCYECNDILLELIGKFFNLHRLNEEEISQLTKKQNDEIQVLRNKLFLSENRLRNLKESCKEIVNNLT